MAEIIMPKMGDAMEEGRILQWKKKVGDTVAAGEAIAEIETDKSNVEIESDEAGTIQSIDFEEGATAPVGAVIATIGASAPAKEASSASNGSQPAPAAPAPVAPAPTPRASMPFRPYDSFVGAMPENLGGTASVVGAPVEQVTPGFERLKASPLARAMARTNNLPLTGVQGTGTEGSILKRDVEAALAGTAPPPAFVSTPAPLPPMPAAPASRPPAAAEVGVRVNEGDDVQVYNAMRRTIATRLAQSKSTIPHFYVTSEIDVEAMLALREQINTPAVDGQPKITVNDFLVKAVAVALAKHPVINSVFSDNRRILRKSINIGIAVTVEDGLVVPVVRDCQLKSLRAVSAETRPLIERARQNKLKPDEYTAGTFTISNMG